MYVASHIYRLCDGEMPQDLQEQKTRVRRDSWGERGEHEGGAKDRM
mgnify:CR=1 FL=1|jgi:hypothetical protein